MHDSLTFCFAKIGKYLPQKIDGQRAARVGKAVAIGTYPIYAHYIAQIFDRPRPEQRVPMRLAGRYGEGGGDGDHLRHRGRHRDDPP